MADAARRGPRFVYTTRDRNTGSSNPQDTCGVYRTDWTPKPAADAVRDLA
jgi:polysaccharide biosynthesis protein PslG